MLALYIVGYFVTLFILFFCRSGIHQTALSEYLDRMGITTPFKCTNGRLSSAMIQALFWPWVLVALALILVLFPVIVLYVLIFKRKELR